MTYRDPATPAVWTYSAPLTAEKIAVNHRELIASYRPIYKREVLGMVIVGALLAIAAVPGSEGVALLVLVATAVVAVTYRHAVEPILRRRSAGGQPRPMTRSFELTEEGLLVRGEGTTERFGWDWVVAFTSETARPTLVTRTSREILVPGEGFPPEVRAAFEERRDAQHTTLPVSTFVDRRLTPLPEGSVTYRESGDTVLFPCAHRAPVSAGELLAIRSACCAPLLAVALASPSTRAWPSLVYVGAAAVAFAVFIHFLVVHVPSEATFAVGFFKRIFEWKGLRQLTVQLCEEGFAVEWVGGWALIEWQAVALIATTEKVLTVRTGDFFVVIPKKAFASGQEARFTALLTRLCAPANSAAK